MAEKSTDKLDMDLYVRDMVRSSLSGVNLGYLKEAYPNETIEEYEKRRAKQFLESKIKDGS